MKMMRYFTMLFAVLTSLPVTATIDLVLTQGKSQAIPVALKPFAGEGAVAATSQELSSIINNDLMISGDIKPIVSDNPNATTSDLRALGADDVVSGLLKALGSRYQFEFQLDNLFASNNTGKLDNRELLHQAFTIDPRQLRALAHRVSDLIYQQLTGFRGNASTKLAYVLANDTTDRKQQFRLEVSDADGAAPQTLLVSSEPIMSPAWSPDGQRLVYVSFENHRARVYSQTLRTGQREIVAQFDGMNNAPAFSPDGTQLALVLSKSGLPKIYTMNVTTKQLTQVTHGPSLDTEPNWMPDGKSLLFTSNRGGTPQIYQVALGSGQVTRLTYSGNYNARPRVLSDGSGFVMMHREADVFGIARQNFADGRVTLLSNEGGDESPSIAPNGREIIYATTFNGRGILAVVSIDGGFKMRLPAKDGDVREPAWSPFLA